MNTGNKLESANLRPELFVQQDCALAIQHFEVKSGSLFIAGGGYFTRSLCCLNGPFLCSRLVFQYTKIRQGIFDFLERNQHLLPVIRNGLVICGPGRVSDWRKYVRHQEPAMISSDRQTR